jgi:hypothetical protein
MCVCTHAYTHCLLRDHTKHRVPDDSVYDTLTHANCRYTPGKCGSFTDQSLCLSTRPGVKCVWNRRQSICQPISGLPHFFMMTVPDLQDIQSAEEETYGYEKCCYSACHSFMLSLLLHPNGIQVLN